LVLIIVRPNIWADKSLEKSAVVAAFGLGGPTAGASRHGLLLIIASTLSEAAAVALILPRLWRDRSGKEDR
jgi:hypothetical protein